MYVYSSYIESCEYIDHSKTNISNLCYIVRAT